jgi:hypothetical protein
MTSHQSSAVSAASILTAATVLLLGYRVGRTHAAWRDVRTAKRSVAASRRHAWAHTIRLLAGALAILVTVAAATFEAAR